MAANPVRLGATQGMILTASLGQARHDRTENRRAGSMAQHLVVAFIKLDVADEAAAHIQWCSPLCAVRLLLLLLLLLACVLWCLYCSSRACTIYPALVFAHARQPPEEKSYQLRLWPLRVVRSRASGLQC